MAELLTVDDKAAHEGGLLFRSRLENLPPRGMFVRASFEESAAFSPTDSLRREAERAQAAGELPQDFGAGGIRELGADPATRRVDSAEPTPMLTAEQANAEGKAFGLTYSEPTPAGAVRWDIANKQKEVERRAILERSRGLFTSSLGLLAQFVAQAKDPLNIASAFIPVVGPTRFAATAARLGSVNRARIVKGAQEGFVGAALVEPIVLRQATIEQADYELGDAILNVLFGTALGGGLHVAGGVTGDIVQRARGQAPIGDRLTALPVESRKRVLGAAVADLAEGRRVEIAALLDIEEAANATRLQARRAGIEFDAAEQQALFNLGRPGLARAPQAAPFDLGPLAEGRFRFYSRLGPEDRRQVEGLIAEVQQGQSPSRAFIERGPGEGGSPEVVGTTTSTFPEFFQRINREAAERQKERARLRRQGVPVEELPPSLPTMTKDKITRAGTKLLRREPLAREEGEVAQELVAEARARRETNAQDILNMRDSRERAARAEIDSMARGDDADRVAIGDDQTIAEIDQQVASMPAMRTGQEQITAAQEELDVAMERLTELESTLEIESRPFTEADEAIERAEAIGRAAAAAASCQIRRAA